MYQHKVNNKKYIMHMYQGIYIRKWKRKLHMYQYKGNKKYLLKIYIKVFI